MISINTPERFGLREQHAHYAAIRARLRGPVLPPRIAQKFVAPQPKAELPQSTPMVWRSLIPTRPSIVDVQEVVARHFGCAAQDLTGPQRKATIAFARQVAMYIAFRETRNSIAQIGRKFGRDHTTALYGIRTMDRRIKADAALAARVEGIVQQLRERRA